MKNKLTDLNDHLFSQLERLSEKDLSKDNLAEEINRAKALCQVAGCVIGNARLALDAIVESRNLIGQESMPEMLRIGNGKKAS